MSASKILDKRWLVITASLFLWIDTAIGSPEGFHEETPMSKLASPVDFKLLVHAECTKTAQVSFWNKFDNELRGYRPYRMVEVNPSERKVSFEIKCDFEQRTATVKIAFTDVNNKPAEALVAYTITTSSFQDVCLTRIDDNGSVDTITMSADIGAFMRTYTGAPGFLKYQGTTVWYGTCRN